MRCPGCQYDLSNLSSGKAHRCPECGRRFHPNDPELHSRFSYRHKPWHATLAMFLVVFLAVYLFFQIALLILLPTPKLMRGTFAVQLEYSSSLSMPIAACTAVLFCALRYFRKR